MRRERGEDEGYNRREGRALMSGTRQNTANKAVRVLAVSVLRATLTHCNEDTKVQSYNHAMTWHQLQTKLGQCNKTESVSFYSKCSNTVIMYIIKWQVVYTVTDSA